MLVQCQVEWSKVDRISAHARGNVRDVRVAIGSSQWHTIILRSPKPTVLARVLGEMCEVRV
jgi:hypothetical protein